MRRHTRLSNGFSRKLRNHEAATALNYFAYNFIKLNRTLRMSPAMAAGVTDRLWDVNDLVALWEAYEQRGAERAPQMNRPLEVASGIGVCLLGLQSSAAVFQCSFTYPRSNHRDPLV